jgi:hypothetical protein
VIIIGGGGGGGLLLLMFMTMVFFVLVPVLFARSARRAVVLTSPEPLGWQRPQPQSSGWELPEEPAVPPVVKGDVVSLQDRLAHDVRSLDPGTDPVSRQALADASERYSTCSTLLERASSQAQLRTAWLAAVEGLTATRLVRTRLGLDPGPEIPLRPPDRGCSSPPASTWAGSPTWAGPRTSPGARTGSPAAPTAVGTCPAGGTTRPSGPARSSSVV